MLAAEISWSETVFSDSLSYGCPFMQTLVVAAPKELF